jgi:hypothetical protein
MSSSRRLFNIRMLAPALPFFDKRFMAIIPPRASSSGSYFSGTPRMIRSPISFAVDGFQKQDRADIVTGVRHLLGLSSFKSRLLFLISDPHGKWATSDSVRSRRSYPSTPRWALGLSSLSSNSTPLLFVTDFKDGSKV